MLAKRLCANREIPPALRGLFFVAEVLCDGVLLLALTFTFALRLSAVQGPSMLPTLDHGQWMLITAVPVQLRHGDIVVVSESGVQLDDHVVKRVIGLPGDVIHIDFVAGVVYRNGQALHEPNLDPINRPGDVAFPITVQPGSVFVLGDNRNNSMDSRHSEIGLVDQRFVIGRVLLPSR
ncbi:MAG: signal peptidase I [Oscillospiraceae bacterium]|nr:signal peptidase I [Oscillospiraceae bacterium]